MGEGSSAFAVAGGPAYLSSFVEQLRSGAKAMLAAMRDRKISSTMLSGDGEANVSHLARTLGLTRL